ncbi:TonB-dependent receptor [Bacteroides sp.]|uniref:SusC/RagA family TonB-linked outer membrane protein n=1 Tax=Bacteroides sp. TaxID=29523 RepID=UPI001B675899|nr:TonB-dependent receptor [Bacteroides sp.]MBP6065698.1 TonB-dependent receptor [Bacteroides sp.]MBP8622459.1 TonB-dependent receptor [Bacteroides sp.]
MKKYLIFSLCLSLLMALFPLSAQAQERIVTGVVVDEIGEPVIGASVIIEKTTIGTITDLNGKYTIKVPTNKKLIVSFIGYITQTVSDFSNPRIVMKEDAMKLDEIVVVGYGTQKMRNVTGAISTVVPEEISDLSVSNLGNALVGVVNGLSVSGGNSRPGEGASLKIRQSSEAAAYSPNAGSSSPLYVIDDFITDENSFNNLDASMIEQITVLKDASAAVYGARSAQGVILVKTKRGQVGAPKISYNGQFGYTDEIARPKMLDSYNYGVIWNGVRAAGMTSDNSMNLKTELFQSDELEAMKKLNYDLLEREWRAAFTQKHSLNMSGGTEKATYFAGISYFTQDGNLGRLDYDRWNYRAGVDAKISKWFKASLQVSGDHGKKNTALNKVGGSTTDADYNSLLTHPRYIPDYINGLPMANYGVSNNQLHELQNYHFNALQDLDNYSETMSSNMTLNSALEYDFSWNAIFKGLKIKASYSKSISTSKNNQLGTNLSVYKMIDRGGSGKHLYTGDDIDTSFSNFTEVKTDNGNSLRRVMSRGDSYQMNFTAMYGRQFGLHDVNGLFSIEKSESESEDLEGVVLDPLPITDGQSKTATGTQSTSFGRGVSGTLSYIGRVNYSYSDRYLLEFLVRSDASTKFAPENYWGVFPSVSAGWVVSEESWFKDKTNWIDYLKIRGSFGILGRDNIAAWGWLQLYNMDANKGAVFGTSPGNNIGSAAQSATSPNRNAHWDSSYKYNVGIDARFLQNRLSVNTDFYYEQNRDVFMKRKGSIEFPSTVGSQPTAENFGSLDTYGMELSLGWRDNIGKNFKYRVGVNTGYSDNKMLNMYWPAMIKLYDQHPNQRTDLGEWGLECLGMFRSKQEIEEYFDKYKISNYMGMTKDDVRPGMLIYKDIRGPQNADGTYQAADGVVDKEVDLVKVSNRSNPYGLTVNLGGEWRGLSFSAQLSAGWGGYNFLSKSARSIVNSVKSSGSYKDMEYTNLPSFWADNMYIYDNVMDADGNVVAYANRDAKYPNLRYSVNNETSTFWKVSGTRITLRNITVAYTLPKAWVQKVGVSSCRFNLTGQNMLSLYNPYPDKFMDPMDGSYGSYSNLRKITLGVNVSF